MVYWTVLLLTLVLAAWPVGAEEVQVAQEGTAGEVVTVPQIIVTATGTEVPLTETGVSATVITPEQIEARKVTRVEEMLRTVPGIVVNQTGGRGGITNLYMRGGNANMSQALLNGIRLNDAGGTFDWATLTLDNVERLEVVRGPMSALYGADAMTGVTNIITRKGQGRPTFTYTGGWGAHSEQGQFISENRFSFSGAAKDRFCYSVAFSRLDDQGFQRLNNRFWSNVLNARFDLTPVDPLTFTLTTLYIGSRYGYPTEYGDRPPLPLDPEQHEEASKLLFGLTTKYTPVPWWTHELTLSTYHRDRNILDPYNPLPGVDIFGGSVFHPIEDRSALDYRSVVKVPLLEKKIDTTTTLGFAAFTERLRQNYSSWGVFPYEETTRANRRSLDFYFQEQVAFWERFFLTAGFRLEDNTAFEGTEFSPRAAAAYQIYETGTTLRAAGGRAIKAPTFTEQYYRSTVAVGNPNLKPEKNTSWEVGVDQTLWRDRLGLGLTYFENHFTDLIAYITRPWPQPSFFGNISKARVRGVEVSLQAKPWPELTCNVAYTYLLSTVLDTGGENAGLNYQVGQPLVRRPKHTVSATVSYDRGPYHVTLNGLFVGRRADFYYITSPTWVTSTGRVMNPGYFLFSLAAAYDLLENARYAQKVQWYLRLTNLLDQKYEETYLYASPRFQFISGLKFVF